MASDLKSDLVMTTFKSRPTVHLMGNPSVTQLVEIVQNINTCKKGLARVDILENVVLFVETIV